MSQTINAKLYDVKKLRSDIKKAVGGQDGLTKEHLFLNDLDLLKEYRRVYGPKELDEYLLKEKITFKQAVEYNLNAFKDSLLGIANGKAYILEGNCLRGDQEFEDVFLTKESIGYVMVGLKTGTILPIARADEHHKGFDLLNRLIKENYIPNDTYLAIFSLGSDYLHEDNFKEALVIYERWLKMGGPNIIIEDWFGSKNGFITDMKTFVEKKGKSLAPRKGSVATIGKSLISTLTELSLSGVAIRKSSNPDVDFKKYCVSLKKLLNLINGPIYFRCQFSSALKKSRFKEPEDLLSEIKNPSVPVLDLIQEIEELVFGMHGFKKIVHDEIRECMKSEEERFNDRDIVRIFGDLQKAFDALGRI